MVAIQITEPTLRGVDAAEGALLSFRSINRRADSSGLSGGAIAGIIIGIFLALGMGFLLIYCCRRSTPLPSQPLGPSIKGGGPKIGLINPMTKPFPRAPQREMYLPQYTGPTQPAYAHTHVRPQGQPQSMPGVVYPVQPRTTYYAPQHHQPQGVRFGEVGVRRI